MSKPGTLAALLAQYPRLANFFQFIPTGDYTIHELYDFNPYSEEIEPELIEMIGEPGEGLQVGVPIVQLDEMYKASLIVKAQVQLLVRLQESGASFGAL